MYILCNNKSIAEGVVQLVKHKSLMSSRSTVRVLAPSIFSPNLSNFFPVFMPLPLLTSPFSLPPSGVRGVKRGLGDEKSIFNSLGPN